MVAGAADMAQRRDRLAAVVKQGLLEGGIAPGPRHDAGAVVRADLGFIGLDDGIERTRLDITLFGQDRFERAHAQLGLGQFRMVVVVIMVMAAHAAKIGAAPIHVEMARASMGTYAGRALSGMFRENELGRNVW
jgi:hypothetical protein